MFTDDVTCGMNYLIHDRDSKFCATFDTEFLSEDNEVVKTPFHSPRANAHAERFVRSVRHECLDHMLILTRQHLDDVMREHVDHCNRHCPHLALGNDSPDERDITGDLPENRIVRRDRLRGLLHEYHAHAARSISGANSHSSRDMIAT